MEKSLIRILLKNYFWKDFREQIFLSNVDSRKSRDNLSPATVLWFNQMWAVRKEVQQIRKFSDLNNLCPFGDLQFGDPIFCDLRT